MPDFVVKQLIQRSVAYAGTGTFRNQDNLIVAVSYRTTGQEDYKLLSVNGISRRSETEEKRMRRSAAQARPANSSTYWR